MSMYARVCERVFVRVVSASWCGCVWQWCCVYSIIGVHGATLAGVTRQYRAFSQEFGRQISSTAIKHFLSACVCCHQARTTTAHTPLHIRSWCCGSMSFTRPHCSCCKHCWPPQACRALTSCWSCDMVQLCKALEVTVLTLRAVVYHAFQVLSTLNTCH